MACHNKSQDTFRLGTYVERKDGILLFTRLGWFDMADDEERDATGRAELLLFAIGYLLSAMTLSRGGSLHTL
jgi:hypothetical protein